MRDFKFYEGYLELHAHHTLWEINNTNITDEIYYTTADIFIQQVEKLYKELDIYALGRSGRHICIEDTPINRRRYEKVKEYTLKKEREFINYINNLV